MRHKPLLFAFFVFALLLFYSPEKVEAAFDDDKFANFTIDDYDNAIDRGVVEGIFSSGTAARLKACDPVFFLTLYKTATTTDSVNTRLGLTIPLASDSGMDCDLDWSFNTFLLHAFTTPSPDELRTSTVGSRFYYKSDGSWDVANGTNNSFNALDRDRCLGASIRTTHDMTTATSNFPLDLGTGYCNIGTVPASTVVLSANFSLDRDFIDIPNTQKRLEFNWLSSGGANIWRLDSLVECTLDDELVEVGERDFYELICPDEQFNLYEKLSGSFVPDLETPPMLQLDPDGNPCTYISYINYNLKWDDDLSIVCNASVNPIVDELLPPLEEPAFVIPTIDLGEIDLGAFEALRPVIEFFVEVINITLEFFGDVVNFFYEFAYNAVRTFLVVLVPNPNSIEAFYFGVLDQVSTKFSIDLNIDFDVSSENFGSFQLTMAGHGITLMNASMLNALGVSTFVKPVFTIYVLFKIFDMNAKNWSYILSKRMMGAKL